MTKTKPISISESRSIPLTLLDPNTGQVDGIPANPRYVTDKAYQKLKRSLKNNPELLAYRELLVFPYQKNRFLIIGGNTRYKALCDLGFTEAPCKIIDAKTPAEKLKRYILIDNHSSGEWKMDSLANGWGFLELDDIGLNVDFKELDDDKEEPPLPEDEEDIDKEEIEDDKEAFYRSMLTDCLYESNNIYDIPTLSLKEQGGKLVLPLAPYGADSRLRKDIGTYHFYVDDYRFEAIWKDPTKVLLSGCKAIVEPNLSLFDTTPIAYGLQQIYKKRWSARTNKPIQHTITHELAHATWNSEMKSAKAKAAGKEISKLGRQWLNDSSKKGYGRYGESSVDEFWAEVIAKAVHGTPDKYTRKAKVIAKKYKL